MLGSRPFLSLLLAAIVSTSIACALDASPQPTASTAEDLVTSRCETIYATKLRAKVKTARQELDHLDTPYAHTLKAELDAGRVQPLPFCKITRVDFDQLRKDTDLTALGTTADEQYASLRRGDAPSMRSIHAQVYGYQWETRIFLSTDMSNANVLVTLAHETKHVLRRAHLRNFHDQRVTCVEELEAFEAEVLVKKPELSDAEILALRKKVNDLYGLDELRDDACTYR